MVFIDSFQFNIKIDEYQKHSLPMEQHFDETLQDTVQTPSVSIGTKDIFPLKFYDALSHIKEISDNEIQAAEISSLMDYTHSVSFWGDLIDADSSQFQGYDDVPNGHFQIYAPLVVSDNQLKDLIHFFAKEGKLLGGGSQALFKALDHDTAKIYSQSTMENFTGRPVDWKKGYMFGTMWDRRMIDEKLIQQFQQEGKQIFTGAIGSIHFSIVY